MKAKRSSSRVRLSAVVALFFFLAFLLLALKSGDMLGGILALAVPAVLFAGAYLIPKLVPMDQLLLSLTNFLCALGILALYVTRPDLAVRQAEMVGIGLLAMMVTALAVRAIRRWEAFVWAVAVFSLLLLALPALFGRETNGARNWLSLGSLSFQPSEIGKLSLVLCLSWWMSRRRLLPWLLFSGLSLLILMFQKDLGTALLYYAVSLLLFWLSSGSLSGALLGLLGGAAAARWGYDHFSHVRRRIAVWINPWKDYQNAGYQLVQSLVAIASGGLFGVGLGLGSPTSIPIYSSDFIFAVICEQFGLIFGICVLLIYVALLWRGTAVAMASRRRFHGLLAMGSTLFLALQSFLIVGGVLKLIPLTGVTLPFISYGGTSMISSLCLAGLIQGVASMNQEDLEEDAHLAMLGKS